ncbi:hydrolase [Campylobacterota bacterium]|nr:hydrolase [Campylobacterota bacterium]
MEQIVKAMGRGYQTNCYILSASGSSLIIDPGIDAAEWVIENAKNPLAILNTHGHFDHVYSNASLQEKLHIPIYIHAEDVMLIESDQFGYGLRPSKADHRVDNEDEIVLGAFAFRFIHFPGHTPGTCMIEFDDRIFSGDFIFDNAIGRYDFPYSNAQSMKSSLERFLREYQVEKPIFAGHGEATTVLKARKFIQPFVG